MIYAEVMPDGQPSDAKCQVMPSDAKCLVMPSAKCSHEGEGLPILTPVVTGSDTIRPRMVFWEGRYISVQQMYMVSGHPLTMLALEGGGVKF